MVSSRRRFRRRFRRSRKGMRRSSRRSLKKLIRNIAKGAIETRFKDFSLGTIASPITSTWSDVNIMPDGIANPPSRSYEIVGIAMKGILASGTSQFFTTDWYNRVRVVIGLWKPRTDHTFTVLSGQVSPPALWEPISTDMSKVRADQKVSRQDCAASESPTDRQLQQCRIQSYYQELQVRQEV